MKLNNYRIRTDLIIDKKKSFVTQWKKNSVFCLQLQFFFVFSFRSKIKCKININSEIWEWNLNWTIFFSSYSYETGHFRSDDICLHIRTHKREKKTNLSLILTIIVCGSLISSFHFFSCMKKKSILEKIKICLTNLIKPILFLFNEDIKKAYTYIYKSRFNTDHEWERDREKKMIRDRTHN